MGFSVSAILRPRDAPHTLEEVSGHEVPAERPEEGEEEEPLSRDPTTLANSGVLLGMQSVEQRTCYKVGWPYHRWRCDKEASCDATNGEADLWSTVMRHRSNRR